MSEPGSPEYWQERAQRQRDHNAVVLERIATERLADLKREFRRRFPKRTLRITFGNGSELTEIDGRRMYYYGRAQGSDSIDWQCETRHDGNDIGPCQVNRHGSRLFQFIADALADVIDICGGYGDCSPNDVMSKPRKNRKV